MNSQTYVSDPRIWEAFYKNMAEKKFNPYKYKPKQIGRGVKSYKSYVIPLRPHSQLESIQKTSTQITPVAVVEKRAKVEHAKDVKKGVPFVKVQGSIKRPRSQSFAIPSKKSKPTTSQNPNNKSSKSAKQPRKSRKTKQISFKKQRGEPDKKTQSRTKKEFKIDRYKSSFKQ
jgi:hypothetical protein